jgi:hypothetical protein
MAAAASLPQSVLAPSTSAMIAAALYTFSLRNGAAVLCLAHVTNTTGQAGDDFEKGEADGSGDALAILEILAAIADAP